MFFALVEGCEHTVYPEPDLLLMFPASKTNWLWPFTYIFTFTMQFGPVWNGLLRKIKEILADREFVT